VSVRVEVCRQIDWYTFYKLRFNVSNAGKVCECPKGTTETVDTDGVHKCLPVKVFVDDECLFGEECQGGSQCSSPVCVCPVTHRVMTNANGTVLCQNTNNKNKCRQESVRTKNLLCWRTMRVA
jgi:hypothetical protein